MKIAAITVTYNDDFKLKEWKENYMEYRDSIYLHIIVDNGSTNEYLKEVKSTFPQSVIIARKQNGGSTAAYNEGITIALKDPTIDSILLLGNDIKISTDSIRQLHRYLYSNERLGMVAPILLKKDSNIVEVFGCKFTGKIDSKYLYSEKPFDSVREENLIVDWVPGGVNLSKVEFYKKVGLQDENLFMYGDEIDISYRSKRKGFLQGVTKKSIAWHRHINPPSMNIRPKYSFFLITRNLVYLGKKHFNFFVALCWAISKGIRFSASFVRHLNNKDFRISNSYSLLGLYYGLKGTMNNSYFLKNE